MGTGRSQSASNDVRPGGRPGIAFRRHTACAPFSQQRESQPAGDAAVTLPLRAAVPISWPFSQSHRKIGPAGEHKFALFERSEFSKFMRCNSPPSPDSDDFPRRRVGQRWAPPPGRSASSFRALQRTVRIPARRRLGRKVTSPPSGAGRVRIFPAGQELPIRVIVNA